MAINIQDVPSSFENPIFFNAGFSASALCQLKDLSVEGNIVLPGQGHISGFEGIYLACGDSWSSDSMYVNVYAEFNNEIYFNGTVYNDCDVFFGNVIATYYRDDSVGENGADVFSILAQSINENGGMLDAVLELTGNGGTVRFKADGDYLEIISRSVIMPETSFGGPVYMNDGLVVNSINSKIGATIQTNTTSTNAYMVYIKGLDGTFQAMDKSHFKTWLNN